MNLQGAMTLACCGGTLLTAGYILWRYSRQRLHRLLALQIAAASGFTLFMFGLAQAPSESAAANWMRYGVALPYLLIFTFFWFLAVVTQAERRAWTRVLLAVALLPALADVAGRAFGLLPPVLVFREQMGWVPGRDFAYLFLYTPTMLALLGSGLALLLSRLRSLPPSLERQNLIVLLAAIGGALAFSCFILFPATSALGTLSPLAYTSVLAFGLTRRRLLNLTVLVREGAAAGLASLVLSASVALVIFVALRALHTELGLPALFIAAFLFAGLYPLQYRWSRSLLGRWLGREARTSQQLLRYSLLASEVRGVEGLMQAALDQLVLSHGLARACLMLPDRAEHLAVFAASPPAAAPAVELAASGALSQALLANPHGFDLDSIGWTRRYELDAGPAGDDETVRAFLEESRCQACFGLISRGRLRGVLLVGPASSGRALLGQELDFFSALSGLLAGLVESAALEGQVQHADRLSTLGVLAASMAHEIRNPLASISVFMQMLPERRGDEAFMEKFLRLVPAEVNKLVHLTDELLDLARPATRAPRVVDLGMLCQRERQLIGHQFRKRQVRLTVDAPAGILVHGVEAQLSQVILNLLINALEASPEGGLVELSIQRRETEALLAARDQGPGIRPERMGQLFEPFFTTKEHGNGLGLATSRRIVESFGGQIAACNRNGGGAEFTVRLPLAQESGTAAA